MAQEKRLPAKLLDANLDCHWLEEETGWWRGQCIEPADLRLGPGLDVSELPEASLQERILRSSRPNSSSGFGTGVKESSSK